MDIRRSVGVDQYWRWAGVPADLVPRGFGPPGPNPLLDLVSPRGFGPLYFRDI